MFYFTSSEDKLRISSRSLLKPFLTALCLHEHVLVFFFQPVDEQTLKKSLHPTHQVFTTIQFLVPLAVWLDCAKWAFFFFLLLPNFCRTPFISRGNSQAKQNPFHPGHNNDKRGGIEAKDTQQSCRYNFFGQNLHFI